MGHQEVRGLEFRVQLSSSLPHPYFRSLYWMYLIDVAVNCNCRFRVYSIVPVASIFSPLKPCNISPPLPSYSSSCFLFLFLFLFLLLVLRASYLKSIGTSYLETCCHMHICQVPFRLDGSSPDMGAVCRCSLLPLPCSIVALLILEMISRWSELSQDEAYQPTGWDLLVAADLVQHGRLTCQGRI